MYLLTSLSRYVTYPCIPHKWLKNYKIPISSQLLYPQVKQLSIILPFLLTPPTLSYIIGILCDYSLQIILLHHPDTMLLKLYTTIFQILKESNQQSSLCCLISWFPILNSACFFLLLYTHPSCSLRKTFKTILWFYHLPNYLMQPFTTCMELQIYSPQIFRNYLINIILALSIQCLRLTRVFSMIQQFIIHLHCTPHKCNTMIIDKPQNPLS